MPAAPPPPPDGPEQFILSRIGQLCIVIILYWRVVAIARISAILFPLLVVLCVHVSHLSPYLVLQFLLSHQYHRVAAGPICCILALTQHKEKEKHSTRLCALP